MDKDSKHTSNQFSNNFHKTTNTNYVHSQKVDNLIVIDLFYFLKKLPNYANKIL
jgi:hypothetical protein